MKFHGDERVRLVPLNLRQENTDGVVIGCDDSHLDFRVKDGESLNDAADRVSQILSRINLRTYLWQQGVPVAREFTVRDDTEILLQEKRKVRGRNLGIGRFSLWKTIEAIPIQSI